MFNDPKILIVDDDEIDRANYRRCIKKYDKLNPLWFEASNTNKALSMCKQQHFDCILVDYNLPEQNGIEFIKQLTKQVDLSETALIMLTGQGSESIAVAAMKAGVHDYLIKQEVNPQFLTHAILSALDKVSLNKQIEQQSKRITSMAYRDPVTNLLNRVSFEPEFEKAIAKARRHQRLLALMFVDLDYFKQVNDTYGHNVGDLVLKKASSRIIGCIRCEDIVARIGGDEFVVVLTEISSEPDAGKVASKIIDALSRPMLINNQKIEIGATIGIATFPQDHAEPDSLIKYADMAMYQAKKGGRNQYQYFSGELNKKYTEQLKIEKKLIKAIHNNELAVVYQPQFDFANREIIGLEALVRWYNAELGYVSPHKIITIAESTGLINQLDPWVMNKACEEYLKLQKYYNMPEKLAVNISPRELQNSNLSEQLEKLLKERSFPAHNLILEITETAIVEPSKMTAKNLDLIRELGVGLSIDDFGTGYASLTQLKNYLPVQSIKIDKSFVNNIPYSHDDKMIVKSIIALAHNLGVDVIAEGVENHAQANFLLENGCYLLQGYYLSHPIDNSKLQRLL
ncbi:MAG: GGDEF domain-containing response regulator [Gammaproteobacteria bacterium]